MTFTEMKSQIRSIAVRSSAFKIGKSGQDALTRLQQHPPKFQRMAIITYSKIKEKIDYCEAKMIDEFYGWKNCKNINRGSAGKMAKSDRYYLYVIYELKSRS